MTVSQLTLGVIPHPFVRIQLRCIRRKPLDLKTRMAGQELFDQRSLVRFRVVPQQDHRATEMPENLANEGENLSARDVGRVEGKVEPEAMPSGADRDAGDDRNLVPRPSLMMKQRSLATRAPGLSNRRNQQKA